jgi:hypothetical protein
MSANATDMRDFIEALREQVPSDLHLCAKVAIHELFSYMRNAVDDPSTVMQLMRRVRERVAQEQAWQAATARP